MGVAVVMSGPEAPVQPGMETVSGVVIRNTGAVVDQFEIDIVGDAAEWTQVRPPTINLMPGEEANAQIVFAPPRSSRVPGGPVAFALRVMSREDTAGSAIQEGVVEVAPYSEVVAEILPRTSTGRRRGKHQFALDNLGNHPELVSVSASDPDLKLGFTVEPANLTLEPGTATFVRIVAKPERTFLRGANVTMPFQATATPSGSNPINVPATMVQQSVLPSWTFMALGLALAGVLGLAVLWFALLRPVIESTAESVAEDQTKELADAIVAANDKADEAQEEAAAAEEQAAAAEEQAADAEETAEEAAGGGGGGQPGAGEEEEEQPGGATNGTTGTLVARDAIDLRVTTSVPPAGAFRGEAALLPPRRTVWITDLVLQNPAGDTGILRVQRADTVLLEFGLQNFRDLDYHFIQPTRFSRDEPIVVAVNCANEGTKACTPSVYFSGQQVSPPRKNDRNADDNAGANARNSA